MILLFWLVIAALTYVVAYTALCYSKAVGIMVMAAALLFSLYLLKREMIDAMVIASLGAGMIASIFRYTLTMSQLQHRTVARR